MNITFFVGNGFDLSSGMKTSYCDFYKWYVKQPSDQEVIQTFKDSIECYLNNSSQDQIDSSWADFEVALGKYTKTFDLQTGRTFDDFRIVFDDARDAIIKYLKQEREKYSIPFASVERVETFCRGVLGFYHELNHSERDSMYKLINATNSVVIQFVSFNYTDCLDRCVESAARYLNSMKSTGKDPFFMAKNNWTIRSSVIHVHGTVNNYPVLGVSNSTQIANEKMRDCRGVPEMMIKSQSDRVVGQNRFNRVKQSIQNSQIICAWGISLGKTDSFWWEKIAEWLKERDDRHLILFWYKGITPNPLNLYLVKEEARKRFLSNANLLPKEQSKIEDRIHVIWNTRNVLKTSFDRIHR